MLQAYGLVMLCLSWALVYIQSIHHSTLLVIVLLPERLCCGESYACVYKAVESYVYHVVELKAANNIGFGFGLIVST